MTRLPLQDSQHEAQFREWLNEHTGLFAKVVRSFAEGPADADDLLQEVLLQVWLALPSFRAESKATTWLYRVALNTALGWKRRESKHRRGRTVVALDGAIVDRNASAADKAADREMVERLYSAVRRLEPTDRALVLLYLDGLSYGEMSEIVGISESNVGVRLHRLKQRLASMVKEPHDARR